WERCLQRVLQRFFSNLSSRRFDCSRRSLGTERGGRQLRAVSQERHIANLSRARQCQPCRPADARGSERTFQKLRFSALRRLPGPCETGSRSERFCCGQSSTSFWIRV